MCLNRCFIDLQHSRLHQEKFEDTKGGLIRSGKSQRYRQYNDQNKQDKSEVVNHRGTDNDQNKQDKSEVINHRSTDNTMTKINRTNQKW